MAEIPMLKGWADEIGPGLKSLGDSLVHVINPNFAVQQELKQRIAADPTLLQKLIDQETLNPGSVSKVFGSQVNKILGGDSSFGAKTEGYLRTAANSGQTTEQTVNDKSLVGNAATREATGSNQAAYKTSESNAKIVGAAASIADKKAELEGKQIDEELPLVKAKAALDLKELGVKSKEADVRIGTAARILDARTKTKSINASKLASKIGLGEALTAEEQGAAQVMQDTDPTTFKQLIDGVQDAARLRKESEWHKAGEKANDRQLRQQAFTLSRELGIPGNINAIMAYISDPDAAQRAKDVSEKKYKPQTEMDRQLGEIEDELAKKNEAKVSVHKIKMVMAINQAVDKVSKENDPDKRAGYQAEINQALESLAVETGTEPLSFQYNNKSMARDSWGFYKHEGDKIVKINDEDLTKIIFAPQNDSSTNTSHDDPVAAWRSLSPEEREKALKQMPAKDQAAIRAALAKPEPKK